MATFTGTPQNRGFDSANPPRSHSMLGRIHEKLSERPHTCEQLINALNTKYKSLGQALRIGVKRGLFDKTPTDWHNRRYIYSLTGIKIEPKPIKEISDEEAEKPFTHIFRKAADCPRMTVKTDPLHAVFFQALPNGGAYMQEIE